MNARPDDRHGVDLLIEELKEEAGRLAHHPVTEMRRLEHVVDEGDSAATPLLLVLAITAVLLVVVAVVMTLTFVVYYRA